MASPVKIQVKLPDNSTQTQVYLQFEYKVGQNWVIKNVIPGYDVKNSPNGIDVVFSQFGSMGDWRIKAKLAPFANTNWTNPVLHRALSFSLMNKQ